MTLSNPLELGAIFVGLVLLLTGVAKIMEPWKFIRHLAQLRLVSTEILLPMAFAFTAVEATLGVALIVGLFCRAVFFTIVALLIGLSVLTYWSTSTGRTQDCGCYNGWLRVTPAQSILLNGLYIVLLLLTWLGSDGKPIQIWQVAAVLATFFSSYALASGSQEYFMLHGRPYIDLTPIRINRRWQPTWLGNYQEIVEGSKLVVFLSSQCAVCKAWLKVLKVVQMRPDLPNVLGVVELTSTDEMHKYAKQYSLNFPLAGLEKENWNQMPIWSLPTAIVLQDGIVKDKWQGAIPKEFIEQIKQGANSTPVKGVQAQESRI